MNLKTLTDLSAALSDPTRVRLLAAVIDPLGERNEVCVCELTELVDLAPSTVSKHLSILRDVGLIEGRKEGRWMYYRAPDAAEGTVGVGGELGDAIGDALRWVRAAKSQDRVLVSDHQRLHTIVATLQSEACCPTTENSACCSSAPATPAGARSPRDGHEPFDQS